MSGRGKGQARWIPATVDRILRRFRRAREDATDATAASIEATAEERAPLIGAEVDILKIVSAGATPEQWAEWLRVPLEHAAATGNHDLFKRLVEAGANCGAGWAGCGGRKLLDAAALGGNPDIISTLLQKGSRSDVNLLATSSKRSALYTAVVGGHEAAARKLIVAGADVDYVDPTDGYPPLVAAVCSGSGVMVSSLLMAGASPGEYEEKDPPQRMREQPPSFTLLPVAAAAGHDEVVSALLEKDVDVNVVLDGFTPLMCASWGGNLPTVMVLLAAGADVGVRDDRYGGKIALDIAVKWGHRGLVKALLRYGADVNARDQRSKTALHYAVLLEEDAAAMINVLLEAGADVDAEDDVGCTPLHAAISEGGLQAALALLQGGARTDIKDDGGNTALHRAIYADESHDVVLALLQRGASVNATNSDGETPLHLAVHTEIIVLALLQGGASVDTRNYCGNTALHEACRSLWLTSKDVVDLFLRSGASEKAINNASQTPLQLLHKTFDEKQTSASEWERGEARKLAPMYTAVRVLLERAPADRAWRRRCLLVMVRARNEKGMVPLLAPSSSKDNQAKNDQGGRALSEVKQCREVGKEGTSDDDTGGVFMDGEAAGGGDADGESEVASMVAVGDTLKDVVGVVVGLVPDAVFREIVLFL